MSRRIFLVALIFFGFLLLLLISCTAEVVEVPATLTSSTVATTAPTLLHSHTSTLSRSDTPTPASPPEPASTSTIPPPVEHSLVEHTVQAGDTLLGIATAYDVPMAAIQLQNGMGDSVVVRVGQVLSIPSRDGREGAVTLPFHWEGASRFWVVHIVKAGETLVGIARAYGLKAAELKAINELVDADLIHIGQELVIPLDAPAVAQAPRPTNTPTSPPIPTHTPTLLSPSPTPTSAHTHTSTPSHSPSAPPPTDIASWPRETVRLINKVRVQHGLPPLAYNETLARAAQAHANDCAQREWCSHTGSDGSDIKTRILRAGYHPASWAECWAQRQAPQGAVDIWMDEVPPNDPHRRTLLTTWLTEIGVGVAQTTWGYYFIADFGRP